LRDKRKRKKEKEGWKEKKKVQKVGAFSIRKVESSGDEGSPRPIFVEYRPFTLCFHGEVVRDKEKTRKRAKWK